MASATQTGNLRAPRTGAHCRSCGSAEISIFLSLGDLPLPDALLEPRELVDNEPRYPLDLAFCLHCTLVQILETLPPEQLFGAHYQYFSSCADTLLEHSERNVIARIHDQQLGPDSLVIEAGSNDGYLLQYYKARGIPVLGVDPSLGPVSAAQARGIETLLAFFGRELAQSLVEQGRYADVIHANNVLTRVADSDGFVAGMATLLKDTGVAVVEIPYVKELIERGEFDTISHESLSYFSVTSLQPLFQRHGLHLARIEPLTIQGGSLRVFVRKQPGSDGSVEHYLDTERAAGMARLSYYADFADRVSEIRSGLTLMLQDLKARKARIVGYGAAAKGATLLNYVGIGQETLDYVVDRNVSKQGRYIPGVRLPIASPTRILAEQPDYLLILPWNLQAEITAQQAEYRRRGGKFIVPIPRPVIL